MIGAHSGRSSRRLVLVVVIAAIAVLVVPAGPASGHQAVKYTDATTARTYLRADERFLDTLIADIPAQVSAGETFVGETATECGACSPTQRVGRS